MVCEQEKLSREPPSHTLGPPDLADIVLSISWTPDRITNYDTVHDHSHEENPHLQLRAGHVESQNSLTLPQIEFSHDESILQPKWVIQQILFCCGLETDNETMTRCQTVQSDFLESNSTSEWFVPCDKLRPFWFQAETETETRPIGKHNNTEALQLSVTSH